jgi:hypothetical protein
MRTLLANRFCWRRFGFENVQSSLSSLQPRACARWNEHLLSSCSISSALRMVPACRHQTSAGSPGPFRNGYEAGAMQSSVLSTAMCYKIDAR